MAKIIEFPKPTIYRLRGRQLLTRRGGKIIAFPKPRHEVVSYETLLNSIDMRTMLAAEP